MTELNRNSFVPLYYQLSELLREQIELGDLQPGQMVPSEHALCKKYHLSRNTAQLAIMKLVNEGILFRQQGKGTFVAEKKTFHHFQTTLSFQAELIGMKKDPETVLKTAKVTIPPDNICNLFSYPHQSEFYYIQRLRIVDNQPIAFQTSYLPSDLCPGLITWDLEKGSLFSLLRQKYHLKLMNADELITCSKADKFESSELQINDGDPIFRLERKTYLNTGQLIEFVRTILPGNKCNIQIKINGLVEH